MHVAPRARLGHERWDGGAELGEVPKRPDRFHAVEMPCGVGLNPHDASVRVRTSLEAQVKHPRHRNIVEVSPGPRDETRVFLPLDRSADEHGMAVYGACGTGSGVLAPRHKCSERRW